MQEKSVSSQTETQYFQRRDLDQLLLLWFLRQVSRIKYLNQMSTYHLDCGDSYITDWDSYIGSAHGRLKYDGSLKNVPEVVNS